MLVMQIYPFVAEFWTNPQYLIEVDKTFFDDENMAPESQDILTPRKGVNIWLAIMQKNVETGWDCPFKVAYRIFEVCNFHV